MTDCKMQKAALAEYPIPILLLSGFARLQDAVNHDPQERKGQLVFLVEFFQFLSSFR